MNKPEAGRALIPLIRQATVAFGFVVRNEDGTRKDALPRIVGSGIAVEDGRVILTAAHVIAEMIAIKAKNELMRQNATPVAAVPGRASLSERKEDGSRDLIASYGLLSFDVLGRTVNPSDDIGIITPPGPLPTSVDLDFEHEPYEGDPVFACGWPDGTVMNNSAVSTFAFGTVAAVLPHPAARLTRRREYVVQMPVNAGNSGGGVFDQETGRLIGIVSSRYQAGGVPTGLSTVVPTHHVRTMVEARRQEEQGRNT